VYPYNMNLDSFVTVVKWSVQTKYSFFTPAQEVINAVRTYNTIRVEKAKKLGVGLNPELITQLRNCRLIKQLNACPVNAECVISKNVLDELSGRLLVLHFKGGTNIKSVHQRFISQINKFYNIVHFDDEIFKAFGEWYKTKSTSFDTINTENIENLATQFCEYNDGSKINLLYVKFNTICDL
jgi:hypothetical protein